MMLYKRNRNRKCKASKPKRHHNYKRKLNHKRMITRVGLLIVSVTMSQKRILDNHLIQILLVGNNLLARGGLNGQCLLQYSIRKGLGLVDQPVPKPKAVVIHV